MTTRNLNSIESDTWQWKAKQLGLPVKQSSETVLQGNVIRGLQPVVAILETAQLVGVGELEALQRIADVKLQQRQDPPNMVRGREVYGANTIFFRKEGLDWAYRRLAWEEGRRETTALTGEPLDVFSIAREPRLNGVQRI